MTGHISLDANASGPVADDALEAYLAALHAPHINHETQAAEDVGACLGAHPDWVAFTSGGTEANARLITHVLGGSSSAHTVASDFEHPAVLENLTAHTCCSGTPEAVSEALGSDTVLVTVAHASSETGILLPIADVARAVRARRPEVLLHTDAVQVVGRLPVDVAALGVDALSLTGHKLGAVPGIGALVGPYVPRLRAAGALPQPGQHSAGAASLAAALMGCLSADRVPRWLVQRKRVETAVTALGGTVVGAALPRLPQTVCAHFPGCPGDALLQLLDLGGVAVSAGTACRSGAVEASPALLALGMAPGDAGETVRLSLPRDLSDGDLDRALAALRVAVGQILGRI